MQQTTDYLMSIDVGDSRIGVALASTVTLIPQPLTTIDANQNSNDQIAKLIQGNNVKVLVVGLPRGLDGQETAQTKMVRDFVSSLKTKIKIPVVFQDEALTSVNAREELEQKGVSYNKGDVDALAATYILNDYISENREGVK